MINETGLVVRMIYPAPDTYVVQLGAETSYTVDGVQRTGFEPIENIGTGASPADARTAAIEFFRQVKANADAMMGLVLLTDPPEGGGEAPELTPRRDVPRQADSGEKASRS